VLLGPGGESMIPSILLEGKKGDGAAKGPTDHRVSSCDQQECSTPLMSIKKRNAGMCNASSRGPKPDPDASRAAKEYCTGNSGWPCIPLLGKVLETSSWEGREKKGDSVPGTKKRVEKKKQLR